MSASILGAAQEQTQVAPLTAAADAYAQADVDAAAAHLEAASQEALDRADYVVLLRLEALVAELRQDPDAVDRALRTLALFTREPVPDERFPPRVLERWAEIRAAQPLLELTSRCVETSGGLEVRAAVEGVEPSLSPVGTRLVLRYQAMGEPWQERTQPPPWRLETPHARYAVELRSAQGGRLERDPATGDRACGQSEASGSTVPLAVEEGSGIDEGWLIAGIVIAVVVVGAALGLTLGLTLGGTDGFTVVGPTGE